MHKLDIVFSQHASGKCTRTGLDDFVLLLVYFQVIYLSVIKNISWWLGTPISIISFQSCGQVYTTHDLQWSFHRRNCSPQVQGFIRGCI